MTPPAAPPAPIRRRLSHYLLAFAVVFAVPGGCRSLPADELPGEPPVAITAYRVPLNSQDDSLQSIGRLRYRGGLVLASDQPHFGGLSGLVVSTDGATFTAISDMGYWVRGKLGYDRGGELAAVEAVRMGPLRTPDGRSSVGKRQGDAESIAPDGAAPYSSALSRITASGATRSSPHGRAGSKRRRGSLRCRRTAGSRRWRPSAMAASWR